MTTEDLYEDFAKPIVVSVMEGINGKPYFAIAIVHQYIHTVLFRSNTLVRVRNTYQNACQSASGTRARTRPEHVIERVRTPEHVPERLQAKSENVGNGQKGE